MNIEKKARKLEEKAYETQDPLLYREAAELWRQLKDETRAELCEIKADELNDPKTEMP